ncbi:MAG: hypothetical protein AB7S26_27330 [Sandaracinaceae bacterium]
MDCIVEIGVSDVNFDESMIRYVRSCCATSESRLSQRLRWTVDLLRTSRADPRVEVSLTAIFEGGARRSVHAHDADPWHAIRSAFASFLDQRDPSTSRER